MDTPAPIPASLDDDTLVSRARAGSAAAFDELIRRYQQRATSIAYRLLGNIEDALEICQDAFIRAYQNLDDLADPSRFRPWLLRIVTNLSLNYRRSRASSRSRISLEDCILNPDHSQEHLITGRNGRSSAEVDPPETPLAAVELAEAIRVALSELTDAQRTALVLFSMEQMPQKEVAAIMECSVEAVKWHVFQARRRLKERLMPFL